MSYGSSHALGPSQEFFKEVRKEYDREIYDMACKKSDVTHDMYMGIGVEYNNGDTVVHDKRQELVVVDYDDFDGASDSWECTLKGWFMVFVYTMLTHYLNLHSTML